MSTQTLSRVTLETLENYRTAATQAVVAYRLGGHRLVGVVNGALENSFYPRTAKLSVGVTERMNEVRGNVSDIVVKGIDQVAERTEKAIELGSTTAAAQVAKVADFAAGTHNAMLTSGLEAAVRITMPGAKLALVVSGKVAEGANKLADAAGAKDLKKAVKKTAKKASAKAKAEVAPVVRKAKAAEKATVTTVKTAAKRATKVVAEVVEAPKAPKAPRAPRAAKKVAAPVAETVAA
jgi:hypothetical protein